VQQMRATIAQLQTELQQLRTTLAVRDQQLVDARAELDRRERTFREDVATERREAERQAARAVYYHALYIGAVPEGQRQPSYSAVVGRSEQQRGDRMPPPPPPAPQTHEGGSQS
jgi:hypothetical protein